MTGTESDTAVGRRGFLRTAAGTVAAAGTAGTAAAQEGSGNSSSGGGGGATKTVQVGPGGQLIFQPEEVQIQPGDTVKWVWKSGGHNVTPAEGDWGHEPLENPGFTYSHTFESASTNEYWCQPHKSAGMVGSVIVGSGGGGSQTVLPGSAKSFGVAAMGAMMSTLGLAYFFIRYGGDYELPSENE